VTVETSFTIMILILLTGGSIEAGYAFYQYNGAQQAVKPSVRGPELLQQQPLWQRLSQI